MFFKSSIWAWNSDKSLKDAVNQIINDLDSGKARVAEKINGEWLIIKEK